MFTVILAFINAKHKHDYELLFFGTMMVDIEMFQALSKIYGG